MLAAIICAITISFIVITVLSCMINRLNCMGYMADKNNQTTCKNPLNVKFITLETRKTKQLTRMIELHNKNMKRYVSYHRGYEYEFMDKYESKLAPYWQKLEIVRENLGTKSKYDVIVWLDSDVLIRHPLFRFDDIIFNSAASIFVGTNADKRINAGIIFLKNNTISEMYVDECMKTYVNRAYCFDGPKNDGLNSSWSGACYEEGIMNELYTKSYKKHIHILRDVSHSHRATYRVINHIYGNKRRALRRIERLHKEIERIYNKKQS